jgi:hypothetical protein
MVYVKCPKCKADLSVRIDVNEISKSKKEVKR